MVRVTDLKLLDAGTGTSVAVPTGYGLLASLTGDTVGGNVNLDLWNDTSPAHRIYLAVKEEASAAAIGLSGLHLASSDPTVSAALYGNLVTHDGTYGVAQPGCQANAGVDLSAGACAAASTNEWYSGWCAFYFWDASCATAAPPLQVHFTTQASEADAPVRCVVLGDEISVDSNQAAAARQAHVYWRPRDVNQDGAVDAADAQWVLDHVTWVPGLADGQPVNLNRWKQSYHRWDWYDCGLGQGYDDLWIHAVGATEDAQYLGYCLR